MRLANCIISIRASSSKEQRMRNAIKELLPGAYPSAAAISKQMGRKTQTLNGPECVSRRIIFREMGIKMKGPLRQRVQLGGSCLDEE